MKLWSLVNAVRPRIASKYAYLSRVNAHSLDVIVRFGHTDQVAKHAKVSEFNLAELCLI